MTATAGQYLREVSDSMTDSYPGDCTAHAARIAELLIAQGKAPWIARLRHRTMLGEQPFTLPLLPQRFANTREMPAWSTHYVACCDDEVYDPLLAEPIALEAYTRTVFNAEVAIERLFDAETTARLAQNGELRRAMR